MTEVSVSAPLAQPLYGANLIQAYTRFWRKYATFSGRASLSEFWWAALANTLVTVVLFAAAMITMATAPQTEVMRDGVPTMVVLSADIPALFPAFLILAGVYTVAIIIPNIAVTVRRLHDTNKPGGYWFVGAIPFVGGILLLVFLTFASDPSGERFDA